MNIQIEQAHEGWVVRVHYGRVDKSPMPHIVKEQKALVALINALTLKDGIKKSPR